MPSPKQLMKIIAIQTEIARLGLDLGSVMNLVVDSTLSLISADGAAIELAEGDHMVYRATSGTAAGMIGLRLDRNASLSGLCVRTGEILRCDDPETDPRVDREACRKVGLKSMIVMPLKHRDTTVGVLKAMSNQTAKFTDSHMALLNMLSDMVGSAMFHSNHADDLLYRATHDGLTGLANRALFMDRLRMVVAQDQSKVHSAGVLMLDMDGLKAINDTFGHRAGDAVIREFSTRIRAVARLTDTVARLGGDEFGIILTPVEIPHGTKAAMDRISSEIEAPFEFEDRVFQLRASIGAAHFPHDGDDINGLIEAADQRMYEVKKNRPNRRQAG